MCLAVPAKILSIDGTVATCDMAGNTTNADISMTPEAGVGDYVIIHAGLAIQKYDEQEALETLALFKELGDTTESQ
ncbi:MAG: HypC/HybG/HupF family hydrogenase formation chaperone [Chitinivibrionales bacterium]|nr:HypC/HybG/HupF family hydrogenase formation chaperone [Chitinivibrionales bacterium]